MSEDERPVVSSPRVIENNNGKPCYLVEYDEDRWNRFDDAGKEHCFETWAKKAKPLGCVFVVLRLFPDPLFPTGERTAPYVARSYPVDQDSFDPFTVTVRLSACIHSDTWERAIDGERMQLKTRARERLGMQAMALGEGCAYEIWTRNGGEVVVVEKGRL